MKRLVLIVISIILLILDNSLIPFFSRKGIYPNLLFVFSVGYSVINGKEEGIKIGVISGLLQDIFFFNVFGINALVNMFCCFIAGVVGEGIWKDKKLIPTITVFCVTILKFLVVYIIFYFIKIHIELLRGIFVAIYNSVIIFLVYKVIIKLSEIEYKK